MVVSDSGEMRDEKALSREREFVENLLNARANFGLVVFGLSVAAAVSAENRWLQGAILTVGGVLAAVLATTIARSQWKLDLILEMLPPTHPAKYIDAMAQERARGLGLIRSMLHGGSRRKLIGYVVPCILSCLLLFGAFLVPSGAFDRRVTEPRVLGARVDSLARVVAALTASSERKDQPAANGSSASPDVVAARRKLDSITRRINDSIRGQEKKP
ncbi:MAG: hypothetical protein ACRELE_05780 [Gemmatimonadales bacterium]